MEVKSTKCAYCGKKLTVEQVVMRNLARKYRRNDFNKQGLVYCSRQCSGKKRMERLAKQWDELLVRLQVLATSPLCAGRSPILAACKLLKLSRQSLYARLRSKGITTKAFKRMCSSYCKGRDPDLEAMEKEWASLGKRIMQHIIKGTPLPHKKTQPAEPHLEEDSKAWVCTESPEMYFQSQDVALTQRRLRRRRR
jgi:hypothetical protein